METRSIHIKRDFLVRLMNEVDWSTPFSIRFFTTRAVSAKVVAFDGENYVGCTLDESTGALLTVDVENWGFTYTLPMAFDMALAQESETEGD